MEFFNKIIAKQKEIFGDHEHTALADDPPPFVRSKRKNKQ